jgi:ribonucleoside-diphosphate reductase alpha chain
MISQELSNYIFVSKYSRYLPEKKRRETWKESVDRVRNMMLEKYKDCNAEEEINWAYDLMYKRKVLGSQRVLQFGGKAVLDKHCRAYNCCAAYCDRLRFFQECMYVLLCGVGAGYSVQKHHVDKLPNFTNPHNTSLLNKHTYIIPDSIEGWADSIGVLLSSYFEDPIFPDYYNCEVEFDYSLIRPKGSYLSSSSGKAPGPEPLKLAHKKIKEVLDQCLSNRQNKLRPIDAHDIICHLSDAVLAGGVRRSALLALFSKDDKEMFNAKIGDWFVNNRQRARANNSVILLRNETSFDEFQELFKYTKEFGEPAIVWSDDLESLWNPCGEVNLYAYDEQGKSGWEFCNLCTINSGNITDEQDLYDRARAAAIIGTLQAGFTDFGYLGKVTENIVRKEALLGVSLSGIMEQTDLTLDKKILKKAVKIIADTNEKLAAKLNINSAARLTCIKPDGQSSCLLGTSSGIHPHHSKRYIRRVQNNNTESIYKYFKSVIHMQLKNRFGLQIKMMRIFFFQ